MIPVAILGATGMVGQHYTALLENHPWFKLSDDPEIVFICNPVADAYALARKGKTVIDNRSLHRAEPDVPVIIPEVNPHHLDLLSTQQKNHNWTGSLIAKPNCTLQSFVLPLAPLHKHFGITQLSVTTLQATSGAGRDFCLSDTCLSHIPDEEEKTQTEPLKILDAHFPISVQCTRVPVSHGHMACVSVAFETNPTRAQILELWDTLPALDLPTAAKPIVYREEPDHATDRLTGGGMSVTAGRLRPCPLLHWRFVGLSHNVIRGAAGGGLLTAELWLQNVKHREGMVSPILSP